MAPQKRNDILQGTLALLVLKPMRRRWFEGGGSAKSPPIGRIAEV